MAHELGCAQLYPQGAASGISAEDWCNSPYGELTFYSFSSGDAETAWLESGPGSGGQGAGGYAQGGEPTLAVIGSEWAIVPAQSSEVSAVQKVVGGSVQGY